MKKWLFPLFLSCTLATLPILAQAARLDLLLQDYRHPGASAYIAIYAANDRGSWRDEPFQLLQTPLAEGDNMLLAAELPPGRYAVRAFVDLNGNGELDTGVLGKPTEPFAFSRSAGAADSLRFKAAVVEVGDAGELTLRFLHPKGDKTATGKTAPGPIAPSPP